MAGTQQSDHGTMVQKNSLENEVFQIFDAVNEYSSFVPEKEGKICGENKLRANTDAPQSFVLFLQFLCFPVWVVGGWGWGNVSLKTPQLDEGFHADVLAGFERWCSAV